MIPVSDSINQSFAIVQSLLANSFSKNESAPLVETESFNPDFESEFDARGLSRVEVLFDTVTTAKKSNVIEIHGLVENDHGERVPLVFFCETEWLDSERAKSGKNDDGQNQKSFVLDFVGNSYRFSSASFTVIFKNADDGTILGKGSGYLNFEKMRAEIPTCNVGLNILRYTVK